MNSFELPEPFSEKCTTCGEPANVIDGRYDIQLCWLHYRLWKLHTGFFGWWLYFLEREERRSVQ